MSVEIIYPADTLARFEAFVVPEPNSGCWLWLGALNKHGYPCRSTLGRCRCARDWHEPSPDPSNPAKEVLASCRLR
jgi:hypothetical protein